MPPSKSYTDGHPPGQNGTPEPRSEQEAVRELTGKPIALGYRPNLPLFSLWDRGSTWIPSMLMDVERMLAHDAVTNPYDYYKAGIASVKFEVESRDPKVAAYCQALYEDLWERYLDEMQHSYDYGWCGYELSWKEDSGLLKVDSLWDFHSFDAWVLTRGQRFTGIAVQGVEYDGRPGSGWAGRTRLRAAGKYPGKCLWLVHRRRFNRFYGRSQLYSSWRAWRRLADRDGAEEVVDMGHYRFAYRGPVMRYPAKEFRKNDGSLDYDQARFRSLEFTERAKAGVGLALPNTRDQAGEFEWQMEWPDSTLNVDGLLGYPEYLEKKISKAIGVPPELQEAADTGSGWSGRKIPLLGYYVSQLKNARSLTRQLKAQVADPGARFNFGPEAEHTVKVSLVLPQDLIGDQGQDQGEGDPLASLLGGQDQGKKSSVQGGFVQQPQEGQEQPQQPVQLSTLTHPGKAVSLSLADSPPDPPDLAAANQDRILARATAALRSLSSKARRDLLAALRGSEPARAIAEARHVLAESRDGLVRLLTDTQLAAALAGSQRVSTAILTEDDRTPALRPPLPEESWSTSDAPTTFPGIVEAARDLYGRRLLTKGDFDALTSEARQQAFTVAGVEEEKILDRVRDALAAAVGQGTGLEDFDRKVEEAVGTGTFLSPQHAETVFRQGVMSAYSNGQERMLEESGIGDLFPYAAVDAIHDDRVRDEHLAMETRGLDGTNVFRRDDPVYSIFRPPWDWQCRCVSTPLSVAGAAARGVKEAQQWLETGAAPSKLAWVEMPPWRPSSSYRRADLATEWKEEEHPRDHGRFAEKDGGSASADKAAASLNRLHPGVAVLERPDDPVFHDEFRQRVEGEVLELFSRWAAGNGHGEPGIVYLPRHKMTQIVAGDYAASVESPYVKPRWDLPSDRPGILRVAGLAGRHAFLLPDESAERRLAKIRYAIGLRVSKDDKAGIKTENKARRKELRDANLSTTLPDLMGVVPVPGEEQTDLASEPEHEEAAYDLLWQAARRLAVQDPSRLWLEPGEDKTTLVLHIRPGEPEYEGLCGPLKSDLSGNGFDLAPEWDESEHPRDHGKFASKEGAASGGSPNTNEDRAREGIDQIVKATMSRGAKKIVIRGPDGIDVVGAAAFKKGQEADGLDGLFHVLKHLGSDQTVKGVGKALMARVLRSAAAAGEGVVLDAVGSSPTFYEKLGFRPAGQGEEGPRFVLSAREAKVKAKELRPELDRHEVESVRADLSAFDLAARHAPAGGITIGGKPYKPGEFIPADVVAKASPQERAKLSQAAGKEKYSPKAVVGKLAEKAKPAAAAAGAALKGVGKAAAAIPATIGSAEAGTKAWVREKLDSLRYDPRYPVSSGLKVGLRKFIRGSWKALMFTYDAGAQMAAEVAKARKLDDHQQHALSHILGTGDIGGAKGVPAGIETVAHILHEKVGLGTLFGAGFVPWATTGWLLYSVVRNPIATLKGVAVGLAKAVAEVASDTRKTASVPAPLNLATEDSLDALTSWLSGVEDDKLDAALCSLALAMDLKGHDLAQALPLAQKGLESAGNTEGEQD